MPRKPKYPGRPGRPPKPKKKEKTTARRSLNREMLFRIHVLDRYFRAVRKDPSRPLLSLAGLVELHRIPRSTLVADIQTMRESLNAPLEHTTDCHGRRGWIYT